MSPSRPSMPRRLSVVLPTRDRRVMLSECLESALHRIGPDDEIVVVDDGSTDGTGDDFTAPRPRVRYLEGEGRGPSAARNLGISASDSRYVAFLDSDDLWLPVGLEEQIAALESDRAVGLCHARARFVAEDGTERCASESRKLPAGDAVISLLARNHVTTSTVIVPRAVLDAVGPFDEELPRSMDRDLWLRIAERVRFHVLDEVVCVYRFHAGQQIEDRKAVEQARCRILEKALSRYETDRPALVGRAKKHLAYRRLRLGRLELMSGAREAAERSFRAAIELRPIVGRVTAWRYRRR